MIPEILALKIALGILPSAIETITTDDETVDGRAAKKKTDNHRTSFSVPLSKGRKIRMTSGKTMKVML